MNAESLSHLTALVVDDERDVRHILKSILQDIGFKDVFEAVDVKNASHILESSVNAIDLILCDWNLPGSSGLEFLEKIHHDGLSPPFLIVSGRSDSDSVLAAKGAGVSGYIRKPFSPEQIESRIILALQRTKTGKACES